MPIFTVDGIAQGPAQTEIRLPSGITKISLADGETVQQLLAAALNASTIEGARELARLTASAPVWIDGSGILRIGGWILQERMGSLELIHRTPASSPSTRALVATLVRKEQTWNVMDLREERITARRPARQ